MCSLLGIKRPLETVGQAAMSEQGWTYAVCLQERDVCIQCMLKVDAYFISQSLYCDLFRHCLWNLVAIWQRKENLMICKPSLAMGNFIYLNDICHLWQFNMKLVRVMFHLECYFYLTHAILNAGCAMERPGLHEQIQRLYIWQREVQEFTWLCGRIA
jgi:hypothetical protein